MEFLIAEDGSSFHFIEANARLQVEHTVTEETRGVDLVCTQLQIADGASLKDLKLTQDQVPAARGYAIQLRVNMETLAEDGSTRPGGGTLTTFDVPSGPGVRTDTYGYVGYQTNPSYDSLLAKLIVHSPSDDYGQAVARSRRALDEFRVAGVPTNLGFLDRLLQHPQFIDNNVYTNFVDDHIAELVAADTSAEAAAQAGSHGAALAGAQINTDDPLAVLDHGKGGGLALDQGPQILARVEETLPDGVCAVAAPMQGTVVSFEVAPGDEVHVGKIVAVMEAMKMEHEVRAEVSGIVQRLGVAAGDTVFEGHNLIYLQQQDVAATEAGDEQALDLDHIRADLQEVFDRKGAGLDENRPKAVAKRHGTGHRTARENIADLCDPDSFVEYGSVVLAAQRRRRSIDDLIENTTGDGMVCGLGQVNGICSNPGRARTMVMSYDYMVLAGTQGMKNHAKKDRLFEVAEAAASAHGAVCRRRRRSPGGYRWLRGGGSGLLGLYLFRPACPDWCPQWASPPAAVLPATRCCSAAATSSLRRKDANIGIGGPAMIEGGGLGVFRPEEVGPMDVQVANGVVDIPVER